MLGSPFPLPLDSFFACTGGPGALLFLRSALLPGGQQQGALSLLEGAKRTGELGAPLAPTDRHLVQLKPLRPFFAGCSDQRRSRSPLPHRPRCVCIA